MVHNKYHHTFSDVLNLSDEMQAAMNDLVKIINEFYLKSLTSAIIRPCNNVDFYSIKEDKVFEYLKFGMNLIHGGLTPVLVDILMQNSYEEIIGSCSDEEIKRLRLQLLFVRKAIKLFHIGDLESYFICCEQLISCNTGIDEFKNFFQRK